MSRHSYTFIIAGALALLTISAAGQSSAAPGPRPSAAGDDGRHRMEEIKAACMNREGFTYIPYVRTSPEPTAEERRRAEGDYEAMKTWRHKHGHGVFDIYVYPIEMGNPMVKPDNPPKDPSPDPNTAIRSSLSRAQARAYEEAEQTCLREAVKRVYGKDVTSMRDHFEQAAAYARRLLSHELDRDPALVERAAAMASCLRAKGYAVGSAAPTALASRGREAFEAIKEPMGEPIPEEQRVAFDAPKGARYEPNLTIEQARPYLAREVRDALDDLECGKDFYRLYEPRRTEIEHRAYREFGLE